MHADQVEVTAEVVARLVADQFPRWRGLAVRTVTSHGTVNALFRLGDEIVLRFPLQPGPGSRGELIAEQDNARRVATVAPVAVPEPLAVGAPGGGYPGAWAAYTWIPGEPAEPGAVDELFATDLAGFVRALHCLDTGGRGWDGRGRGGPLAGQDAWVRESLAASRHLVDTDRLARIWASCRDTPAAGVRAAWLHTDLMPGNLLVRDGRLAAVLDLGSRAVGDPAVDLMPAWNLLPPAARETYRRALDVDDASWERGRGWALVQAIGALWYYVETNPVMAGTARHTLAAILT